jgi:hypothetical protein
MSNKTPTRFPNGATTAAKNNPLGKYGLQDPTQWHSYFNDFNAYGAADWTVTNVGTTPTQALTDVDGGVLLLTNAATDNSSTQLQKVGADFLPAAGKQLVFKARFAVSDITQSDWLVGLGVTDTTVLGAVLGAGLTDGMFFAKDDGTTNIYFCVQKDATTGQKLTQVLAVPSVAGTYQTYGFYFDGVRYVYLFVDDVQLTTVDLTATLATYLPDAQLTPTIAMMNGEAVAKTMSVDYIFAAQERVV